MTETQIQILILAISYSFAGVFAAFLVSYLVLRFFLKPRPNSLRVGIAFLLAWLLSGLYVSFKSVAYYQKNFGELFVAALIVSAICIVAVSKLSYTKSSKQ